jgi:hypothetical protein
MIKKVIKIMVDKYNLTTTQNLTNLPAFISMEQEIDSFKNNNNEEHSSYSLILKSFLQLDNGRYDKV